MSRFSTWKTVTVGMYRSTDELAKAFKIAAVSMDNGYAPELIRRIRLSNHIRQIEVLRVRVGEFFGTEETVTLASLYDKAGNLGCAPLLAEAGLQIAMAYPEQPRGETLLIGMDPVTLKGHKLIFALQRLSRGQCLTIDSDRTFAFDELFLFQNGR